MLVSVKLQFLAGNSHQVLRGLLMLAPIIIMGYLANVPHVAVTGRKRSTLSGLIRLVISLECFIEITPDFMCPFMND